jgi:hypothetical protein
MPFIRGRYHINPVAGEALEAAREAEAALLALEQAARASDAGDDNEGDGPSSAAKTATKGPVHRIEIEAAQFVPAHSGRASRGFVARIHRTVAPATTGQANSDDQADGFADEPASSYRQAWNSGSSDGDWTPSGSGRTVSTSSAAPETQVFADHRDLIDFLRDLLASECNR